MNDVRLGLWRLRNGQWSIPNAVAIIRDIQRSGATPSIARSLEAHGVPTPSGDTNWQAAPGRYGLGR